MNKKKALYFVSGNRIRVYRRQSTQVRFGRESTNHVIHDGALHEGRTLPAEAQCMPDARCRSYLCYPTRRHQVTMRKRRVF